MAIGLSGLPARGGIKLESAAVVPGHLTPWIALALLVVAACQDVPLPATATPTFVTPKRATTMQTTAVRMPPGETLTWSVRYRGMPIGTAALEVRGNEDEVRVESRFETVGVAAQLRPVKHRLVTSLAHAPAPFEDVHSALGRVRAWARTDARPATLRVRHGGQRYLLKLAQPLLDHTLEAPAWRIEAEVNSQAPLIKMTLWLSTDANRVPLQVTLSQRGQQIWAQLVEVSES